MQICKNIYLKKRTLKNGMVSLSLDYYPGYRDPETGRVVRQEALNIYIYSKAKTQREKDYNATMLEKAEAVRCMRFQDVVNGRYGFLDKNRYKGDFLEYYRQKIEKKNDTKPLFAYKHFEIYCHGKCYFEELDVDFCNGKYVSQNEVVSLQPQIDYNMANKSKDDQIRELKAALKQAQKRADLEELRAKAYDKMIDLAEEHFNIPIRKKSGTKQ